MLYKLSIIIGVLLIGVSCLYYFVYFLPKQARENTLIAAKEKCIELGRKEQDKDFKNYPTPMNPKYGYNPENQTCIYSSGFVNNQGATYWIKDLYTNREIKSLILFNTSTREENETLRTEYELYEEQQFDNVI